VTRSRGIDIFSISPQWFNTYWGEISATGFTACIPIMIFAFVVQKQLVRGISFGAVKG
jgi:multiple sugar transport system permease protein